MATLKEISEDKKFESLSPEAKSVVFDKVSKTDESFSKLSSEAQGIVRAKMTGVEISKPSKSMPIQDQVVESFKIAGLETARGVNRGIASVNGIIANIVDQSPPAQLAKQVLGKKAYDNLNVFRMAEDAAKQSADSIPRSPMTNKWIGSAYNFIGESAISIPEFNAIKGVLTGGKVALKLSEEPVKNMAGKILGKMTSPQAVNQLIENAATGATIAGVHGMDKDAGEQTKDMLTSSAFIVVLEVAPKALIQGYNLGKTFGESAFKAWMRTLGVSHKAVEAFMKDPRRFKLWSAIESSDEKADELLKFKTEMTDKNGVTKAKFTEDEAVALADFQNKQTEEALVLQKLHMDKRNKLTFDHAESQANFTADKTNKIEALKESSKDALDAAQGKNRATAERLLPIISQTSEKAEGAAKSVLLDKVDFSLKALNSAKESAGESVALTLEHSLQKNPMMEIPAKPLISKIDKIFKEFGFTKNPNTGVVESKIAGVDEGEMKRLHSIFTQFNETITADGGITVAYLQDLKSTLQRLGVPKNPAARTSFEAMYAKLGHEVNVANMGDAVPENVRKALAPVFEANKRFATIKGEYDKAVDVFGSKEIVLNPETGLSSEKIAPNIDKLLAIRRSGSQLQQRQISQIDSQLPEGVKIGKALEEAYSSLEEISRTKISSANSIKRKLSQEYKALEREKREILLKEKKAYQAISSAQRKDFKGKLSEMEKMTAEQNSRATIERRNESLLFNQKKRERQLQLEKETDGILKAEEQKKNKEIEFLKEQESISSILPKGSVRSIATSVGGAFLATQVSPLAAMGVSLASPKIMATVQRFIGGSSKAMESATEDLAQFVKRTGIEEKIRSSIYANQANK